MTSLFKVQDIQQGPRANQAMNRYWYDSGEVPLVDAIEFGIALAEQITDFIRLIQSDEWEHVFLFLEDVLNPANTALIGLSGFVGTVNGDPTPASNAWSFPLKPTGPIIKRGRKSVPGVPETWTDDELPSTSAVEAILDAASQLFTAAVLVDADVMNPVVVREPDPQEPGPYIVSPIIGSVFRQIGTQVSRKLSRGGGTGVGSLVPYGTGTADGSDFSSLVETSYAETINTHVATLPAKSLLAETTRG